MTWLLDHHSRSSQNPVTHLPTFHPGRRGKGLFCPGGGGLSSWVLLSTTPSETRGVSVSRLKETRPQGTRRGLQSPKLWGSLP
ncbi:hypothetical protein DPEC_G00066990 [Dallia pectoralis]|uniref:Uncharacterized protein n=1 Tax=Dallia pectoralis TaxID=75939 RepID=A0ACC2H939_DALPE|nr:hypothetical protein DPEC_G00066990 [Dallia pectoralis]